MQSSSQPPVSSSASSQAPVSQLVLQESQDGQCATLGNVDNRHAGFSGDGFIDTENLLGAYIRWQVHANQSNVYKVHIRFANGGDAARPGVMTVNENNGASVDFNFNATNGWATWSEESYDITLSSGSNTIELAATSDAGLPNIDYLAITGAGISSDECPLPDVAAPTDSPIGFASLNGGTTGGMGGEVVHVSNYQDLKQYAESSAPYIIMINGTISNGSAGGRVSITSNKSLLGVGNSAFLDGVGLEMRNANNIIVRNLKATLVGTSSPKDVNGGDIISIHGSSKNIWIDHCELYSENPDVQTNIDKYDGLIDIKGQTGFITLSWNYLHDHHKGGLVGAADDDLHNDRKVTMHHNYYNKVKLRVPMYRGSTGHFFNNYIVGARDATEIRANTCVRVERNYYEALHYSIYTTSDSPGKTERIGNIEVDRTSRAYPSNCTANIPYDYSAVLIGNTQDVKTLVPQGAGVGKLLPLQ